MTLSGLEHGLTPIAEACPSVHVFDRPALCLDALWLPYRRDPAELEACVRSAGPVKAIFGHADVVRVQGAASLVIGHCLIMTSYDQVVGVLMVVGHAHVVTFRAVCRVYRPFHLFCSRFIRAVSACLQACVEQCCEGVHAMQCGLCIFLLLSCYIVNPNTQPVLHDAACSWAPSSMRHSRLGRGCRQSCSQKPSRPTLATTTSPTWLAARACSTLAAPTKVGASCSFVVVQGLNGVLAISAGSLLGKAGLGCLGR